MYNLALKLGGLMIVALVVAKRLGYNPVFAVLYFFYSRTYLGKLLHLNRLSKAKRIDKGPHSNVKIYSYSGVAIKPIPILDDNYSYLIIDYTCKLGILVDPSEPRLVQKAVDEEDISVAAILTTHRHWDHSGGNDFLKKLYPEVAIYGNKIDNISCLTHPVADGSVIKIGTLTFDVIATPGHTNGHVVYVLNRKGSHEPSSVFSGDHLFLAGCGRMFEGDADTMLSSLDRINEMDEKTLIWPGHEYAQANLKFAIFIEPGNIFIQEKLAWVHTQRVSKMTTCPSTLLEERSYNPFLRTHNIEIGRALGYSTPVDCNNRKYRAEILLALRLKKNSFKAT